MQDTLKYLGTRDMQVRVVIFPKSRIETPSGVKTTKKNQKKKPQKQKTEGLRDVISVSYPRFYNYCS